jgi:hypothetical protein
LKRSGKEGGKRKKSLILHVLKLLRKIITGPDLMGDKPFDYGEIKKKREFINKRMHARNITLYPNIV